MILFFRDIGHTRTVIMFLISQCSLNIGFRKAKRAKLKKYFPHLILVIGPYLQSEETELAPFGIE